MTQAIYLSLPYPALPYLVIIKYVEFSVTPNLLRLCNGRSLIRAPLHICGVAEACNADIFGGRSLQGSAQPHGEGRTRAVLWTHDLDKASPVWCEGVASHSNAAAAVAFFAARERS